MLEISGAATGPLDEPLSLRCRGSVDMPVTWRARLRDDDGRVWRSEAASSEALDLAWAPAKPGGEGIAALRSLHPVRVDVRAELEDGRSGSRTVTRVIVGDGVKVRRWREGMTATLFLPAADSAAGRSVVIDATGGSDDAAALSAALLASRGVAVLALTSGTTDAATAVLASVPGAVGDAQVIAPILAPGIGVRGDDDAAALARAHAWRELLDRLGILEPSA